MASIFIGPVLDLVHGVLDKIWPDQNTLAKAKADAAMALMKGEFDLQLTSIREINATMQAEAKSEHWMQWSWRPTVGFSFAAILINNVILMPYMAKLGVIPIPVPDNVWTAMLVILGAAAAGRSFEKWQKNNGNGK